MARGQSHRPLTVLRWVLLALLLASAAGVLWLYLSRDDEGPTPRSVADGGSSSVRSGDAVQIAEGFVYEVIDEGVTLFLIRADKMVMDREDRFQLEGVELRMEEESGDLYTVTSNLALYDTDSRDANLAGSVVMSGPDGLELRGEAFDLLNSGRILESTAAPVGYRLPGGYEGRATGVRINLNLDTVLLRGSVEIASPPGAEDAVRLTATRMLYEKQEGLLRCEGGVVFTRGDDWLTSQRLSVTLGKRGEEVAGIRFVQGRWQVAGGLALGDSSERRGALEFTAETMGVAFDEAGKRVESVDLEGGEAPATLRLDDGAGLVQSLRSPSIRAGFTDGAVSRLETYLPAVLEEGLALPGAPPLRRLCGDSLVARLGPGGTLSDLLLEGAVDYRDSRLAASGERLAGDPESELRLLGSPARLLTSDYDVEAPEVVYSGGEGTLLATGGVRASGLDRSGVELATGDDRLPVLVTAEQARWTEEPSKVVFRGKVRAWQGESFLLADRLRALEGGARLEGDGKVKTVWRPRPGDQSPRPPIEVNAEEFVYVREERRLSYTGAVRAHETGRTLRCTDLEILVDDERRIESLLCEGDVVVEDPANGRTVRGDEALYTPGDRLVLISGTPVVLEQSDGTEMEGRRLRYDLDSGQVRILSEPRSSGPEAVLAEPVEPVDG